MKPELHLFIIWEYAQFKKKKILDDIEKKFTIVEIYNIKWDEDNFSNNITRFYGVKLPSGSFKELECGTGRFTLVTVLDHYAVYENRQTSKGVKNVNSKMFDAKELYRNWTGGGHKIHATNDPGETRHDLMLLLGKSYNDYMDKITANLIELQQEKSVDKNLLGCIQWSSLTELFNLLNETSEYLVLRNFEGMPKAYYLHEHGDIDLLVRNPKEVSFLLNATPVFKQEYRTHYKVNIDYQTIRFDLRFSGDGYYDCHWQQQMLDSREFYDGFFVPSEQNFKYSLLYHALVHKREIANDYKLKLNSLGFEVDGAFVVLQEFMKEKKYKFTEPKDFSVYYNESLLDGPICWRRKFYKSKIWSSKFMKKYLSQK